MQSEELLLATMQKNYSALVARVAATKANGDWKAGLLALQGKELSKGRIYNLNWHVFVYISLPTHIIAHLCLCLCSVFALVVQEEECVMQMGSSGFLPPRIRTHLPSGYPLPSTTEPIYPVGTQFRTDLPNGYPLSSTEHIYPVGSGYPTQYPVQSTSTQCRCSRVTTHLSTSSNSS